MQLNSEAIYYTKAGVLVLIASTEQSVWWAWDKT